MPVLAGLLLMLPQMLEHRPCGLANPDCFDGHQAADFDLAFPAGQFSSPSTEEEPLVRQVTG